MDKPTLPPCPMADRVRALAQDIGCLTMFLAWLWSTETGQAALAAMAFDRPANSGTTSASVEQAIAAYLGVDLVQLRAENEARGAYMRACMAWAMDRKEKDETGQERT